MASGINLKERTVQSSRQWQIANDEYHEQFEKEALCQLLVLGISAIALKIFWKDIFSPKKEQSFSDDNIGHSIALAIDLEDEGIPVIQLKILIKVITVHPVVLFS